MLNNQSLSMTKLEATGNDFILYDATSPQKLTDFSNFFTNYSSHHKIAQDLCTRHYSVGADGFIILMQPDKPSSDLKWEFYNADGSTAEMCGNALRCVGLYAHTLLKREPPYLLETQAGVKEIFIENKQNIKTDMGPIKDYKLNQTYKTPSLCLDYDYVNSGVPHLVIKKNDLTHKNELRSIAQCLRPLKNYSPHGCNITFYKKIDQSHIQALSFERGVEDFTLSCGTGALAAAFSHKQSSKLSENEITSVTLPGGTLVVSLNKKYNYITGPAKIVCTLSLSAPN